MSIGDVFSTIVPASMFAVITVGSQMPTGQRVLEHMNSLINASNAQIARLIAALILIAVFIGAIIVAGVDLINNQPIPMMVLTTLNIAIGFGLHALGVSTGADATKAGAELSSNLSSSNTVPVSSSHAQSANPPSLNGGSK